ncbi:MAG TPA: ribbon-helix-helix protein, CopG family [Longimicrobium sp.]|nr:ribbon-helix-helix protein, CopG family [Longimicrobium sp.]
MRESISISLPDELEEEINRISRTEGISRGDLVREALREYLSIRRFRALRLELMPYAEAAGIHTDEDVFRAVL